MIVRTLCFLLCLLLPPAHGIDIDQLGALQLSYHTPAKVEQYTGARLSGRVMGLPGAEYWLRAPENIQRLSFLVNQGERVTRGQPLARLCGPEIFHFLAQFEATRTLHRLAKARYLRNKPLMENGAISAQKWLEISDSYLRLELEYEHMHHFIELITHRDAAANSVEIGAPVSGRVTLSHQHGPYVDGAAILSILAEDAIRIRANVPLSGTADLSAIEFDNCTVPIASTTKVASGGFVYAWSAPIPGRCALTLGQQLRLTPVYRQSVYRVPKSSVFTWDKGSRVFGKQGNGLQPIDISIVAAEADDYLVRSDTPLEQTQVLSRSVAAVKGVLLGLGGE